MTEKCGAEKFLPRTAGLLHSEYFIDSSKPLVSVIHFSVTAFIQANVWSQFYENLSFFYFHLHARFGLQQQQSFLTQ
jgi:hypothetical protein